MCYEIALLISHNQLQTHQQIETHFKGMATAHSVPVPELLELFEELTQYTQQVKNETDELLELEKHKKNYAQK